MDIYTAFLLQKTNKKGTFPYGNVQGRPKDRGTTLLYKPLARPALPGANTPSTM